MLCAMLFNKSYSKKFSPYSVNFQDSVHIRICDIVSEYREDGKEIFPSTVAKLFSEEELVEYNSVLASGDNVFGTKSEERFFNDCLQMIKKESLTSDLKELNKLFAQETDLEKRKEIVACILQNEIGLLFGFLSKFDFYLSKQVKDKIEDTIKCFLLDLEKLTKEVFENEKSL